MLYQRFGFSGFLLEESWERNLSTENVLIDSHGIIIVEGVNTSMHFVDEDAKGPPVYSFSMALIQDDLRRYVLGGSTNCKCSSFVQDLGETEIS